MGLLALTTLGLAACGNADPSAGGATEAGTEVGEGEANGAPTQLTWEVVGTYPHDTDFFTQGLVYHEGTLFESTGVRGESTLWEISFADLGRLAAKPDYFAIQRSVAADPQHFGEGLERVGEDLIWLTWEAGVATRYDIAALQPQQVYAYEGEGWGLCHLANNRGLGDGGDGADDSGAELGGTGASSASTANSRLSELQQVLMNEAATSQLVMSNGTNRLTLRSADDFKVEGVVEVFGSSPASEPVPVDKLNELECVKGLVWANVWKTDRIVVIDPATGKTVAEADMSGLLSPHPASDDPNAVLNGIAYRPETDTFLLTGKRWPQMFEVRFKSE